MAAAAKPIMWAAECIKMCVHSDDMGQLQRLCMHDPDQVLAIEHAKRHESHTVIRKALAQPLQLPALVSLIGESG